LEQKIKGVYMFISMQNVIINSDYIKEIHAGDVHRGDNTITINYIDGTEKTIEYDDGLLCEFAQTSLHDQLEAIQIDCVPATVIEAPEGLNLKNLTFSGLTKL